MAAVDALELEIKNLRQLLIEKDERIRELRLQLPKKGMHRENPQRTSESLSNGASYGKSRHPLLAEEYQRYGRQMILSEVGLPGTSSLLPPSMAH